MSADDLWLIREHDGRYWPVHAFASAVLDGNIPEIDQDKDPAFFDVQGALDWCTQNAPAFFDGNIMGTEYGPIVGNELGIRHLRADKAADADRIRNAIQAFAKGVVSAFLDAEPFQVPLPGNNLDGGIVIASVSYREANDNSIPIEMRDVRHGDDLQTILLLNDEPPYYTVGTGGWDSLGVWRWDWKQDHMNIVPAVNGDKDGTNHLLGYIDAGGDY